jgi:hypothetical protein
MKVSDTERNITILKKIVKYCDQIDETKERLALNGFG